MDTSDPAAPKVVHGFVHRDSPGYRIEETWDTLGMRATTSNDTILDRAFVPDEAIILVCPAGFAGAGMFQVALFAWALLGFAGVYSVDRPAGVRRHGRADARRTSIALTPLDGLPPRGAAPRRRDAHPPRGDDGPPRPGVRRLVDRRRPRHGLAGRRSSPASTTSSPGRGPSSTPRSTSPAARASSSAAASSSCSATPASGRIHPGNSMLTHELVGKLSLGINPDEQPRWG